MAERPGAKTAPFIAFLIVDELVRKLVAKGALTKVEAVAMYEDLAMRMPALRGLGRQAAANIRNKIIKTGKLRENPADLSITLVEVFAEVSDLLSYYQDAISDRSLSRHRAPTAIASVSYFTSAPSTSEGCSEGARQHW